MFLTNWIEFTQACTQKSIINYRFGHSEFETGAIGSARYGSRLAIENCHWVIVQPSSVTKWRFRVCRVCAVNFQESRFESSQTSHEPVFCFHSLFPHPHFPLSPSLSLSDIDKLFCAVQVIHLLRPQTQIFRSESVLCLCSRFSFLSHSPQLKVTVLCSAVQKPCD